MRKTGTLSTIAAACVTIVLASAPAAAGTRASDNKATYSGPDAAAAAKSKKTDVGPRNGFPDSPGLANAYERANDNAAFKRNKSNGAA